MSFATKYSKATPKYNVRIQNPAYTTLADLYKEHGKDEVYPIAGVYINRKGKYGDQGCIAINESLMVNLPAHLLEDCEKMQKDDEATDAINNGLAGFKVYQYTSKAGNVGYSVDWVDIK